MSRIAGGWINCLTHHSNSFRTPPGIEQFELGLLSITPATLGDRTLTRVGYLRMLIKHLHVRMRGCAVEIEKVSFNVFALIDFVSGMAK